RATHEKKVRCDPGASAGRRREAASEGVVRDGRSRAREGRAVHRLSRQRRGRELRKKQAAGVGDDLRSVHTGGIGFLARGESLVFRRGGGDGISVKGTGPLAK